MKVNAAEGSPLEKAINAYRENLTELRKQRAEDYKRKVDKQLMKIERENNKSSK